MRCNREDVRRPGAWVSAARLATWSALLVGAVVALQVLGDGVLATPSITEPSAWVPWARVHDPLVVAVALLRLLALAGAWYLVGVTAVGVLARLLRLATLVRLADTLTVPVVRRLLHGALGVGLATASIAGAGVVVRAPHAIAAQPLAPAAASHEPLTLQPLAPDERLRLEPLPEEPGAPTDDAVREEPVAPRSRPADTATPPAEWVIGPGEHLWAVAAQTLTRAWGRAPAPEEVDPYWRALVERNRERLVDRHNPDLVHPGQRFLLPELPGDPAEGGVR